MKKLPPLLVYSVLRLLFFLVPLAVMLLFFPILREQWWASVICAALIGMSLSIIFLRRPLSASSERIYERRESRAAGQSSAAAEDADAEDAVLDEDAATETSAAAETADGIAAAPASEDGDGRRAAE